MDYRHVTKGAILIEKDAPMMPVWHAVLEKFKLSLNSNTCHIETTPFSDIARFNKELDVVDSTVDTVIITDEKWKLPDKNGFNAFEEALLTHANLVNKTVIVLTHGYNYTSVGSKVIIASYPLAFLMGNYYNKQTPAIKPKNLLFGFSCLNRRAAPHRILLGYELYQKNLLNELIFTQGTEDIDIWTNKFSDMPDFDNFKNLLPINSTCIFPLDFTIDHPAYTDAYCNIVTETEVDSGIITEKSYKPFLSKQVPIFLAGRGHLGYLKSLGFEVFENLLPLNYDQMNTNQKIKAIVDIVGQGREFIEDFYFNNLSEIEHNYKLYTSGCVEQLLIQQINLKL
jgi:hypothetical protein